jgi:hypothetical protein
MMSKHPRLPRLPTTLKAVEDEERYLTSGKIDFASSLIAYDSRVMYDLFQGFGCCPMLNRRDLERDIYGVLRPFVRNEVLVKKYVKRKMDWTYNESIPTYMLNVLKQDCCHRCLKIDLMLEFISKHKVFIRFAKHPKCVPFRNHALRHLNDVISTLETNMRQNSLASDGGLQEYSCIDCRFIKITASLLNRGLDAIIPAPGSAVDMSGIDQSIWNKIPDRDNSRCMRQAKELKKFIMSPHQEVQKVYFKLVSAGIPSECAKAIFKFL